MIRDANGSSMENGVNMADDEEEEGNACVNTNLASKQLNCNNEDDCQLPHEVSIYTFSVYFRNYNIFSFHEIWIRK